jgi:hypothetical protein
MAKKSRPKYKEQICVSITTKEIVSAYELVHDYLIRLKQSKTKHNWKTKAATDTPALSATEIVYCGLHGYTKKNKLSNARRYLRWATAPETLMERVELLVGKDFSLYLEQDGKVFNATTEKALPHLTPIPKEKKKSLSVSGVSDLGTDPLILSDSELEIRMQRYVEDFDMYSVIDKDLLRNLIRTLFLIEVEQGKLIAGKPTSVSLQDLKELGLQVKNYTTLLGLTKKDRDTLSAKRQKGSIAELAMLYEKTQEEYMELENDFLIEELNLLLNKYERLNLDGARELSAKSFRIISGGFTLDEARELTGRKRKKIAPRK